MTTLGTSRSQAPPADATEAVLADFFAGSSRRAAGMGADYARLWDVLRLNTQGGKRLRPRLVHAAYTGLGGTDTRKAAHVAAAFELLHTALLAHDDVIDNDFHRRSAPNIAGTYRDRAAADGLGPAAAAHRGHSAAIIAGDLALTSAYRLVWEAGCEGALTRRLLELLDEAVFASAGGEILDVDYATGPAVSSALPGPDEVLAVARLKTAVYSFETPLQAGAVLAGADAATVALLGDIGRLTGTAYQLVDDLLGVFGDETRTGKTTVGDLAEGKYTLLMSYAATRPQWPRVAELIGRPELSRAEAAVVRALLEESGARRHVAGLAAEYAAAAESLLADPVLPAALQQGLAAVLDDSVRRNR